ncbi:carbamoyltransferase HypF [Coriobacteriia bacterium Es71-Z0120]|uniref:carbamoyltransferase HypF n=1 Tax=Parvivirga hydrogeniphila TaxID=2939460 RepID=UPI00226101C5|nr:carbamoyltransferase HypF [Parvivirga hydrogeniphila]MCL4078355.1 carbamoyltransferase HypF [Parvivirga hydrogeniphila]
MSEHDRHARLIHLTGIVQGVGFRPFVYNLARRTGVFGWVRNASDGVWVHAEADADALAAFERALVAEAPPMARIAGASSRAVAVEGFESFSIVPSRAEAGARTLISPDIATCPACISELFDPADRRYRYPFINCTNCGPRFTIIADIPYDRPLTSMRAFEMCPECAAEYADPADRRFHAQPDACFVCGPRLYLNLAPGQVPVDPGWQWSPAVETEPRPHRDRDAERARSDAILAHAGSLLRSGAILAVKGLGGFQLACDATNEDAVARLRERKRRYGKPLAVMVRTLDDARAWCEVTESEADLLASPAAPIVLLAKRSASDPRVAPPAPSLAPRLREIGVMLPYTPLHHLLLEEAGVPLVMTSGNVSEEPICTGNAEALERLAGIADAFLLHDRDIVARYDDSVARVGPRGVELVRRARGYAPFPLSAPEHADVDVLACGPEQKNTVTLLSGDHAFITQHIGDMENAETFAAFERAIADYERLFRIAPRLVAYDLHPEYLPTKHARSLGLPAEGVQHHHAHVASVLGEHAEPGPVIGVAFDGTGYGTDGAIWGGEVLLASCTGFERFAHLEYLPLPGGEAAIRRPARMAIGALAAFGLLDHPGAAFLRQRLAPGEEAIVRTMVERRLNTPLTSSAGRLFDAVAALAGVRDDALYEGQAAIELEAIADRDEPGAYPFGWETATIRTEPAVRALLEDLAAGVSASVVSMRFHRGLAVAIVDACERARRLTGLSTVAISGGVFMNRILTSLVLEALDERRFRVLTHRALPVNDGGVSFGQAIVAWARHQAAEQGGADVPGHTGQDRQ